MVFTSSSYITAHNILYSEHICKEQQNTVKYSALSTIFIAKNPFFFPPPVSIKHNALLDAISLEDNNHRQMLLTIP